MELHDKNLEQYCLKNSTSPIQLLDKVERETHLLTLQPQMMSGPLQGAFIGHLVSMIRPKRVLEIGTFTGYTSIWIAEHLAADSKLYTIEVNPETHAIANDFFKEYPNKDKIISILGDAKLVIPPLKQNWDLVLIDAGKKDNELYYDMLVDGMNAGAYFLLDNVLWKSKVLEEEMDKTTELIHKLNQKLASDDRVEVLMLPIRDGLSLIRKK